MVGRPVLRDDDLPGVRTSVDDGIQDVEVLEADLLLVNAARVVLFVVGDEFVFVVVFVVQERVVVSSSSSSNGLKSSRRDTRAPELVRRIAGFGRQEWKPMPPNAT